MKCIILVLTSCNLIVQVLEFLPELLDTLKDEGYSLTESEVAIFLPCLIEKVYINKFDSLDYLWILIFWETFLEFSSILEIFGLSIISRCEKCTFLSATKKD